MSWQFSNRIRERITAYKLAEALEDVLPHGSGVNYKWHAYEDKQGRLLLTNAYDVMNEMGYEVGSAEFVVVIDPDNISTWSLKFINRSSNLAIYYGVREYLEQIINDAIEEAAKALGLKQWYVYESGMYRATETPSPMSGKTLGLYWASDSHHAIICARKVQDRASKRAQQKRDKQDKAEAAMEKLAGEVSEALEM